MTALRQSATWYALEGAGAWGKDPRRASAVNEAIKIGDPAWPFDPNERDELGQTIAHVLLKNWPSDIQADPALTNMLWTLHEKGVDFEALSKDLKTVFDMGRESVVGPHRKSWAQARIALDSIARGFERNARREKTAALLDKGGKKSVSEIFNQFSGWHQSIDGIELGEWAILHMFDGAQWGVSPRGVSTATDAWSAFRIKEIRQVDFNALLSSWQKYGYQNPRALMLANWATSALALRKSKGHVLSGNQQSREFCQKILNALGEGVKNDPVDPLFEKSTQWHKAAHTARFVHLANTGPQNATEWIDLFESRMKSDVARRGDTLHTQAFTVRSGWEHLNIETIDAALPKTSFGAETLLMTLMDAMPAYPDPSSDHLTQVIEPLRSLCINFTTRHQVMPSEAFMDLMVVHHKTRVYNEKHAATFFEALALSSQTQSIDQDQPRRQSPRL